MGILDCCKSFVVGMVRKAPIGRMTTEKLLFYGKQGYWPNLENPQSFSEKINWRKLFSTNPLYATFSDKLAVRDYVTDCVGEEFLIPLLYAGKSITANQLLSLGDNIVVKATHDSGSVEIIGKNNMARAEEVIARIEKCLAADFGSVTNQWWYSEVPPRVVVEKLLITEDGGPPWDFKFFVLKSGSSSRIIIEVDYDRNTPKHRRCFYDENRQLVQCNGEYVTMDDTPNDQRPFPHIERFSEMLDTVNALAEPFDHVRVDLYYHNETIYFGELTFSEGGGRSRWYPREFDFVLGLDWDLRNTESNSEPPKKIGDPVKAKEELLKH